jgi:hypothetical protein
MYETKEEFNQKLAGCIVLLNNTPVHILEAAGGTKAKITLTCQNLRAKTTDVVSASDPGWDFRSLGSRLGYTNVDFGEGSYRQAMYVTRMAIRQASRTQGLSQHNVKYDGLKADPNRNLQWYKPSWGQLYSQEYFLDTLERKYPSINDLRKVFEKDKTVTSKAFDPKFAISKPLIGPFYLEYRGKDIGYSDDMFRWKIGDCYDYLRETLEHINIEVA